MKDYTLNLKFYRIINGYFDIVVNGISYKIIYPDHRIKYEAEKIYVSLMQDSRFDTEYLNSAQLEKILSHHEIWLKEDEEKLDRIYKQIDKLKIRLFENYQKEEIKNQAKSELEILKNYQQELLTKKHSLDYLTLEFFANNIKNQYIISQCVLNTKDEHVFAKDYSKMDLSLLKDIIAEVEKNQISADDLRSICRGDSWRRYLCQDNIFGPSINLNDDQANLMSLQRMYDNVRKHPECPEENVIEDADALDGWFLFQQEKNKKNKQKNQALNKVRGKINRHDFVYVITNNKEEAEAIEDLNDQRGKSLISAVRNVGLKDGETMKWKDIPFIKQEIQAEAYKNQKQGVPVK